MEVAMQASIVRPPTHGDCSVDGCANSGATVTDFSLFYLVFNFSFVALFAFR